MGWRKQGAAAQAMEMEEAEVEAEAAVVKLPQGGGGVARELMTEGELFPGAK